LKRQYAFEKLNDREKDMFEEYQKRINDSVNRQAQL
jgi:23S rRNA G2445 N2-methylase RlmL